jgi:hypothetical protein
MTIVRGGEMAFPLHNTGNGAPYDEGMTLRDYIAIAAMQSMIVPGENVNPYHLVRDAFKIADVMMELRDSGE